MTMTKISATLAFAAALGAHADSKSGEKTEKKNITVWVIAFGTELTSLLSDCASSNRAYQANNSAELSQTFADIAARISQLRVTH